MMGHRLSGMRSGDSSCGLNWMPCSSTLYGIQRDDVDYIMETFPDRETQGRATLWLFRTKELILEIYDAMAEAARTGKPYQTILDPPPGQGPRHPLTG